MTAAENPPTIWPHLAGLTPELRQHVRCYPQEYRGQRWYILHDESNGKHLRFNQQAYEFIGRLDGKRTVESIWEELSPLDNDTEKEEMTQDDVVLLLSRLLTMNILRSELPFDVEKSLEQYLQEKRMRRKSAFMNPMAIRIPLLDPDRFLNRFIPWLRPLFSPVGMLLWLFVVILAILLGLVEAASLSTTLRGQGILEPANLLMLVLIYPLMKIVHELSHGFAVKMWGGEVHEMGITLLVFMPVPYVDASAAWAIRDKHKRILVSAIGIMMELFLAALAMFVWVLVEPGLVRDVAFNVMLIGSVSTILFNANPLLRFDGYYVLQDSIEIPNLYTRASRYYLYLVQRYLLGMSEARTPVNVKGERAWFVVYGLAALFYRYFIMIVIILFLAESYLFVGVLLGVWMFATQLIRPIIRGLHFLLSSSALQGRRSKAVILALGSVSALVLAVMMIPIALTTNVEGIVWVPNQAHVFTTNEGFVSEVFVEPGSEVVPGTPLLRLHNPEQEAQAVILRARQDELHIKINAKRLTDKVESKILEEELATVDAELAQLEKRLESLLLRSEVAGKFILSDIYVLQGRYLHQGQLIAYIVNPEKLIVRSVLPQDDIGLLHKHLVNVEVRLAESPANIIEAQILRETPAASSQLPSRALGAIGGGDIAIMSSDNKGLTADEKVFHVDLRLPDDLQVTGLGGRAYIRFNHGTEPLFSQWLRNGRQLLLSRSLL
jgi:putative peptide zinc metalloprotease protein